MTDKTDTQSDAERARKWTETSAVFLGGEIISKHDFVRLLALEFAAVRAEERERCLQLVYRVDRGEMPAKMKALAAAIRRGE